MFRDRLISALETTEQWDVVVIGGGATGLGVALESSSRGLRTVLLEQSDFCKGTSSKSTKLIHGGVRYLEQGNLPLVMDALRERGRLLKNAPHTVKVLSLVIPVYSWSSKLYYGLGLKLYEWLARGLSIGPTRMLSRKETLDRLPGLSPSGLRGGVLFYDAQFDDAALAISLARTASGCGATLLNYFGVTALLKEGGRVCGVRVRDRLSDRECEVRGKVVVNCTGVFSDRVRQLDTDVEPLISASRGSHLAFDRSLFPGESALLIPRTSDGRVLFLIPWYDRVIAGTTDIWVGEPELEPWPETEEVEFILSHLGRHLDRPPQKSDVRSIFAGLRPLVSGGRGRRTGSLSRDHRIVVSGSGLTSVLGGKWTTYRKMAEDAVDRVAEDVRFPRARSRTSRLRLLEAHHPAEENSETGESRVLHPGTFYTEEWVVRAVREEWACQVEDVLARRTRLLLLDARLAMEVAPRVAELMARELGCDSQWELGQVTEFRELARRYLPEPGLSEA